MAGLVEPLLQMVSFLRIPFLATSALGALGSGLLYWKQK